MTQAQKMTDLIHRTVELIMEGKDITDLDKELEQLRDQATREEYHIFRNVYGVKLVFPDGSRF